MVAVEGAVVTDRFHTLIRPPAGVGHFSPFNVSIHGITPAMVLGAPTWPSVLNQIVEFVAGRPVVAHNAAFDLGVIRDACTECDVRWPDLSYACTLVLARRTWRLLSYSLPWVVEAAGGSLTDHHDPLADALAASQVMSAILTRHERTSVSELLATLSVDFGHISPSQEWRGCQVHGLNGRHIPTANADADPNGPLYGLRVCFTGTLMAMTRAEAHALLAAAGGQPLPGVTRQTDMLVVGTQDPRRLRPGTMLSGKQRKAQLLLDEGQDVEVISEADFLQRLASSESNRLLRPESRALLV
jgi:DNA polymerase-3 subunit epsilon